MNKLFPRIDRPFSPGPENILLFWFLLLLPLRIFSDAILGKVLLFKTLAFLILCGIFAVSLLAVPIFLILCFRRNWKRGFALLLIFCLLLLPLTQWYEAVRFAVIRVPCQKAAVRLAVNLPIEDRSYKMHSPSFRDSCLIRDSYQVDYPEDPDDLSAVVTVTFYDYVSPKASSFKNKDRFPYRYARGILCEFPASCLESGSWKEVKISHFAPDSPPTLLQELWLYYPYRNGR